MFSFSHTVINSGTKKITPQIVQESYHAGFTELYVPDHVGYDSPFSLLAYLAALPASEHMTLGTMVLNAAFWSPGSLAREVATLTRLTNNHIVIGIGAGHMKSEFASMGALWKSHSQRMHTLENLITGYQEILEDTYGISRNNQPPLMLGGMSLPLLELAGKYADIINISLLHHKPHSQPGIFRLSTYQELIDTIHHIHSLSSKYNKKYTLQLFIQIARITDNREAAAQDLARIFSSATMHDILTSPAIMLGTAQEIAQQCIYLNTTYGIDHFHFLQLIDDFPLDLAAIIRYLPAPC